MMRAIFRKIRPISKSGAGRLQAAPRARIYRGGVANKQTTGGFAMTVNVDTQVPQTARTSLRTRTPSGSPKRPRGARRPRSLRDRLAVAFRKAGVAVGEMQAFERTKDWCRANGGAWAQSLD
jgi:hypothetical protein